ncbi:glycosyltransferase [Flavobacterium terrisoli]|uniref:glycosyltransferase n=1 Tax=Flavobacterium terrisoli TaxID=3242195 RepID=UPI002543AAAA|nr:glycosyltransferase [Flavobacterium buctense]
MIRVLHIQETIRSGGVERRRLSMAKLLDKQQFEMKLVCQHKGGTIGEEIEAEGVEVICLNRSLTGLFDRKQHKSIQKIIEDFKPHIIHGAVFEGVTMAAINGYLKKVPIIIIEETSDPQNRSWKGNLLMRFFAFFSDRVIGVSKAATDYLVKIGIPKSKVVLINNGVSIPRVVSAAEVLECKKKFGIQETDFVIGSVGRMQDDNHKRFSDLIKSFALFAKEKSNVKLLLVGDGKQKETYIKLAAELGIGDKVIFAGSQYDVTLFYNMMNIFALFSAYEAFGLVLAEAMMNKLPVVATRVGGMQYIVADNETGFLVEKFETAQMTEKFEILYSNDELRISFGQKGLQRATAEFSEKRYVAEIKDLYLRMCAQKNII